MSQPDDILARDTLGAFTRHTHATARGSGSGPLSALAFGAKDIFDVAGHRTGFGSPTWFETHGAAIRTAPAVQRLLDAGADLVGRTQTDELTWSLFGENAHYGTPENVNAPGRVPGGSSSGSAAATAGGLVDFALGSDTGGSVRMPASFCGIYGMRPTHGRIPLDGACALAPSYDTAGWFARDPDLFERVGRVLLADEAPPARPGKLLLATDAFALAGGAVADALADAVRRVEDRLGGGTPVTVSAEGLAAWGEDFRILQAAEIWRTLGEWVTREKPALGPGVKERFEAARSMDPRQVEEAQARRKVIASRMTDLLADDAVLAMPTGAGVAPPRNAPQAEQNAMRTACIRLLCAAGHAGLPQVSLPFARLNGLPIGLSLLAAPGNDTMLLAIARELGAP